MIQHPRKGYKVIRLALALLGVFLASLNPSFGKRDSCFVPTEDNRKRFCE